MSKITQTLTTSMTYIMSIFSMSITFENIKNVVIFIFTLLLLIIQIKLHLNRLVAENKKNGVKTKSFFKTIINLIRLIYKDK